MEQEFLQEIRERILKAFMDMAILARLMKGNPMSAYDVIAFVDKKFDILLSSGTVYSVLYSMERDGLIKGVWNQRKRVYKLTEKGEKTIKDALNMVEEIQSFIKILLSG